MKSRPLSGLLAELQEQILQYALSYGLDFYPVIFEMCDYDTINILASLEGFPARYPHWRFGMNYDQMSKGYAYGLQKIYEMVINTDPCYAYLLNSNPVVDQKTVMAHVYGHADFFKNNLCFSQTNRKMMDVMANNGSKIRRYREKLGIETVEEFIDCVLSLDNLLDPSVLFTPSLNTPKKGKEEEKQEEDGRSAALKSFMSSSLSKKSEKEKEKEKEKKEKETHKEKEEFFSNLNLPTRDVLSFFIHHAPLKEWQADILGLLREEAYYFLPQRMTKIMNEGWASYWHSLILTRNALNADEIVDFADHHAGVMAMSKKSLNPYKIGIELFRDIEFRWNTGRFGKDYEECDRLEEKENWNRPVNQGRQKIFEVRKMCSDITFIDEFFTKDFCERQQLFTYAYNSKTGRHEIEDREFENIKKTLLGQLANFGSPVISVVEANYKNRSELLMRHTHYGQDLDINYIKATLTNVYKLWKRPVNLETIVSEKKTYFSFNGKELEKKQ